MSRRRAYLFRTAEEIRWFNVIKAVGMGLFALVAATLVWMGPDDTTAVSSPNPSPAPTVVIAAADNGVITATPTIESTATYTPPAELLPTNTPDSRLPTQAATAQVPTLTPTPTPSPTGTAVPVTITEPEAGESSGYALLLRGTAPAGSEITILDDEQQIGRTTADADGVWRYVYASILTGERTLTAQTPADGRDSVTVTHIRPPVDPSCVDPAPGIDLGDKYIVGECEWIYLIATRLEIDYTRIISRNPELPDADLLFPGQVLNLPSPNER